MFLNDINKENYENIKIIGCSRNILASGRM